MKSVRVKVSEAGRLTLPAELLKIIDLDKGGDVIVELDGRDLRIRTVGAVIERAQELTRRALSGKPDVTVDDFLAERRREAAKEHVDAGDDLALLSEESRGPVLMPSADHPRAGWAQVAQEIAAAGDDGLVWSE